MLSTPKHIHLRPIANTEERTWALALLEALELPVADLHEAQVELFSLSRNEDWIGVGGYEVLGQVALLRSMAIRPAYQKMGFGHVLCEQLEEQLKTRGVEEVYLLTETAEQFFTRYGFTSLERHQAPEALKATAEFAQLCPSTAVCMHKRVV